MYCLRSGSILLCNYFRVAVPLRACALRHTRDNSCLYSQYVLYRVKGNPYALTFHLREFYLHSIPVTLREHSAWHYSLLMKSKYPRSVYKGTPNTHLECKKSEGGILEPFAVPKEEGCQGYWCGGDSQNYAIDIASSVIKFGRSTCERLKAIDDLQMCFAET